MRDPSKQSCGAADEIPEEEIAKVVLMDIYLKGTARNWP